MIIIESPFQNVLPKLKLSQNVPHNANNSEGDITFKEGNIFVVVVLRTQTKAAPSFQTVQRTAGHRE